MGDTIILSVLIIAFAIGCCWEMYLKHKYPTCGSCGRPYEHCTCYKDLKERPQ